MILLYLPICKNEGYQATASNIHKEDDMAGNPTSNIREQWSSPSTMPAALFRCRLQVSYALSVAFRPLSLHYDLLKLSETWGRRVGRRLSDIVR